MSGPPALDLRGADRAPEQIGLDRLRGHEHVVVTPADRRHEPAYVLAVGDHGIGVAVDAPGGGEGEQVRRRPGLTPHRRPQHEPVATGSRAGVGGGENRPAGERSDHRFVPAPGV